MNSDRVEGTVDDITGRAQEAYGDLAGDSDHKVRGMARQASGRVQHAYGEARDYAREYAGHAGERVARQVEQQPVTTMLIVGAVGFALGLLAGRR
ncbi:CsbD family protein [Pseudoroseomonas globiformis]|uniref:CsbD family protein n=1 Tax=Teichococcus globiformis TaxID=2307229 RepID=A0ABV7FXG2_9PROT